jgi:hypothetical protein
MEIDFGDNKKEEKNTKNKDEDNNEEIVSDILTSDIPAEEWQREVEKVSSKLKVDYSSKYITGEWRSHMEQLKNNEIVYNIK